MLRTNNIRSVTDFARNTRDHIERLQASGEPEILTINGKAAVVVQDAEAYQRLLDLVDYADTVQTLKTRLQSFKKGRRGRLMRQAVEDLAADAGIDLPQKAKPSRPTSRASRKSGRSAGRNAAARK